MAYPNFPRGAPRVVVAGGGALGLTCAVFLARRGAQVTLCDPAPLGGNASGVAAGMLAPAFEALLDAPSHGHFPLLSAARDRWPAFAASLSLTLERAGALWAGPNPGDVEAALIAMGARARGISASEAAEAVSGLRLDGEAVFTAEDWRIDVADALLALRSAAQAAGVVFAPQAVAGFTARKARLATGDVLEADALVAATGADGGIAPELAALSPVKGHILRMAAGPKVGPVVRAEGVYVRPHPAGAVVGASMEAGVGDRTVDPRVAADLARRADALFPGLGQSPYQIAVGVRATTDDGLPLVGASVEPGVLLAAGARRNGWLLAPSIGEAIAALVLEDPTPATLWLNRA